MDTWSHKLVEPSALRPFAAADGPPGLSEQCLALLAQQRTAWARLAQGVRSLEAVESRTVDLHAWPVTAQFNPGRAASSLAKVDAATIARRPCFLCPSNSPPEQVGLRAGAFILLANPAPIVAGHMTVVHEHHAPQALEPHLDAMLQLARDLGRGWTLFYNGPACGASAPDHMHFQAAFAGQTPIERCLGHGTRLAESARPGGTRILLMADAAASQCTRCVFVIRGGAAASVEAAIRALLTELPRAEGAGEPLLNVLCRWDGGEWVAVVFPRAAHRPRCYFAEGGEQLLLSPGVMDMAGLLITVRPEDFQRADRGTLAAVYREVTLEPATCRAALARLQERDTPP